jgi:hypothetical protein
MPAQLIFPAFTTMLETVMLNLTMKNMTMLNMIMLNMALWSGMPFGFDDLG